MYSYVLKRLLSAVAVLFGASLLVFVLVINSGDPLQELRESNAENVEFLIQQRIAFMNLDEPWYSRYWIWLSGIAGCAVGACEFGTNMSGQDVGAMVANSASSTLRLVFLATILSIIIGILTGIITAIRQYSSLDYAVSFFVFLFFSLPVFWAAVLAKDWMGITYNNWLREPNFTWTQITVVAVVLAIMVPLIIGGSARRRLLTGAVMFGFVLVAMPLLDSLNYAREPRLGPAVITLLGVGLAFGLTALLSGLRNRRVLYSALTVVGLGLVSYYATFWLLIDPPGGWLTIAGLFVVTIAVAVLVGRAMGGHAKGQAVAVSVITAALFAVMVLLDHFMRAWPGFLGIKPRPIATIGSSSPNFSGDFWQVALDQGTQLVLPTTILMLVSVATYTRYTRSSMLEAVNQDYIRTARAKGVNERTVVFKHAFRNSMIPLTTIVAFDFAGLIGGAVVVEQVFGWSGMGDMFVTGLSSSDPAPVMAFTLITGAAAVLFNLIADLMYAVLDPRIRV
ncbi:ABC transporter permease [Nesterenkonia sandarakina]|uniref:Peptide/nickel transport system permease protein n=1 Tax=Nesterenkonia sandarakina TaxID=272918 RepID=A0A2T0YGN0_9MICC|nr:ABC transporter permease [Nesterenkonia sandarakina]PRZ14145.1 peptide/nickel transport system permease protein [Nesterenkonia sandarakina]